MKHSLYIVLSVFLLTMNINAQSKNEKIYHLIKIWGVIKYYHPEVQKGNIDWDSIFIREADNILKDDQVAFSKVAEGLLNAASRPTIAISEKCRYYNYNDLPFSNLDFEWLKKNDLPIAEPERMYLYQMVTNYVPRENVYVRKEINKYYLNTPVEKFWYPSVYLPDKGHAVLALARYWNIINYFDPHKDNFGEPWNNILINFIPEILSKSGKIEFYLAFAALTTQINDSHGFYYNYEFDKMIGLHEPAIFVAFLDKRNTTVTYISDTLKKVTGIVPGDIITKLNGDEIDKRREYLKKYFGGSHQGSITRQIDGAMFRGNLGQEYRIQFKDSNDRFQNTKFVLTKDFVFNSQLSKKKEPVQHFTDLRATYIGLSGISTKLLSNTINKAAKDADYLILDFRFGGQRTNWNRLLGKFTNKRVKVAKYYSCSFTYPGYFKPSIITKKSFFSFASNKYSKKVIILVNENVQSSMEFNLMMLKAAIPDLTIIGRNTAGADGAATSILVQQNVLTYFTRDVVLFPDDRKTQGLGIVPDLYVEESIDLLRSGKDAILEKTLHFITNINENEKKMGGAFDQYR